MIEYNYTAKNKDGELVKGLIEADNPSAAAKVLGAKSLFPIQIVPKEASGFSLNLFGKIKLKDKAFLARQLATSVNAGLPIAEALEMIRGQITQNKLKEILTQVTRDVESGTPLSVSFGKYPDLFTPTDITLLAAGETSGTLDKILLRIADSIENDYNVGRKIRSAMIYPAFILVVVFAVVILMSYMVMPQMETLYASFHSQLPFMTRLMIGFSHFVTNGIVFIIISILALILLVRYFIKTKTGRAFWDNLKINLPIVGGFLKNVYVARFARTLAGLVGSGVALVESLNIVSKAMGNTVYEKFILDAAEKVKSGIPLSTPLKNTKEFPIIVSQMIKVGEQTGELDNMLTKLAEYFEEEVDNFVKSISSIVEPVLIVTLAIIVGVIMLAIMMPIYNIGRIL